MLRRVLAACFVLLAVGAAPAAAKLPPRWVGMLGEGPLFDKHVNLDRELRTMHGVGVRSVRIAFYGWDFQPQENGPTSLARPDRIILAAAKRGEYVLPDLLGSPAWARMHSDIAFSAPTSDKGYGAFVAMAQAFVARYGPTGTLWAEHPEVTPHPIRQWQIWNEEESPVYWRETPRLPRYVELLKLAYPAIKQLDPGAQVITGGMANDGAPTLAEFYKLGGGPYMDAAAIHPFTYRVPDQLTLLRRFRKVMDRNGDAAKPMYLTELSWPSAYKKVPDKYRFGFEVTEGEQAYRVKQAYTMLAHQRTRLKIAGVYWASWLTRDRPNTYPFNYAGLRRLNRKDKIVDKPAYRAFRAIIRKLSGA